MGEAHGRSRPTIYHAAALPVPCGQGLTMYCVEEVTWTGAREIFDMFQPSQAEMLSGCNDWVEHFDSGVAKTECMFSSSNIFKKLRIVGFDCIGETVVDLHASRHLLLHSTVSGALWGKLRACMGVESTTQSRSSLEARRVVLFTVTTTGSGIRIEGCGQSCEPGSHFEQRRRLRHSLCPIHSKVSLKPDNQAEPAEGSYWRALQSQPLGGK